MIKVAIKHWIYDYCINLIFEGISSNFRVFNMKNIKIGDRFDVIEKIEDKEPFNLKEGGYKSIYYNCVVVNVRIIDRGPEIIFFYEKNILLDNKDNVIGTNLRPWLHRCFVDQILSIKK
jgi:hypothetical protein